MIGRFSILQTFCEQAVSRELLSATKTFLCVQFIVFSVFVVNIWSPAPELVTAPAPLSASCACQRAAMVPASHTAAGAGRAFVFRGESSRSDLAPKGSVASHPGQ